MRSICGMVSFQPDALADQFMLRRMNQSLYQRGPHEQGSYAHPQTELAMHWLSMIGHHYDRLSNL